MSHDLVFCNLRLENPTRPTTKHEGLGSSSKYVVDTDARKNIVEKTECRLYHE